MLHKLNAIHASTSQRIWDCLLGTEDVDHYIKAYRQFNESNHNQLVRSFPHVRETLLQLHNAGIKMGVVTSKIRKTALMGLEAAGLLPYMSALVTEGDVTKGKPDPEPIVKALNLLDADPELTLMVGDREYDILAAKASGVVAAAVAWSLKDELYLKSFSPNYILRDIRDLLTFL